MVREGRVLISVATDPDFGSSYYVTAYEVGAQVTSGSSGNTVTVRAGHGFAAADKFIVGTSTAQFKVILSVTSTVLTLSVGTTVTVAAGDLLVNLGADTGASLPNYDGSGLTIYTDMDYSNVATNNTVQTDSNGKYRYYHKGIARWELVRSSLTAPFALYTDTETNVGDMSSFPVATGFNLSDVTNVLAKWYRTGDANPLFSFAPLSVDGAFAILMRLGDRAQTTGDSRTLLYVSSVVDSPGATESQAIYALQDYTGASSSSQIAIHGIAQSRPGAAAQLAAYGMQGIATFYGSNSGSLINLFGVTGAATASAGVTGTVTIFEGVEGVASNAATALTVPSMYGVRGRASVVRGITTIAAGGRFDMPDPGATTATNNFCVELYGTPIASLAFNDGVSYKYLRWNVSNSRFELSHALYAGGIVTLNNGIGSPQPYPMRIGTWPNNSATSGSDTACTNGSGFAGVIFVPQNCTIRGIKYLIGSVGGTDKVIASLHNYAGTVVAHSDVAGDTVGALATTQTVRFDVGAGTGTYDAYGPAYYWIVLTFNGTTAKLRTVPAGCDAGSGAYAGKVTQTFGTSANFAVPTSFNADTCPVASVYL